MGFPGRAVPGSPVLGLELRPEPGQGWQQRGAGGSCIQGVKARQAVGAAILQCPDFSGFSSETFYKVCLDS